MRDQSVQKIHGIVSNWCAFKAYDALAIETGGIGIIQNKSQRETHKIATEKRATRERKRTKRRDEV